MATGKQANANETAPAMPYEAYRAQNALAAQQQARELKMDVAPPGGRYLLADGTAVDANGKPITEQRAEDSAASGYEAMTVPELRELAEKRTVDVPADARKAEVIAALEAADAAATAGS